MFSDQRRVIINEAFQERISLFGYKSDEILSGLMRCTEEEAMMLKFLYSTMPISDIANYPFKTFVDYAEHGIYLWKNSEFTKTMPEDIFLNYVVHHRINEEEIAPCRKFFYDKLRARIQNKNIQEATLQVNYWCSEEATYQSTDERTVSPMTVYKGAYGRCGEESTFTVSALRSVGIPARQVYAPRWSHCDDNHAWVEVWIAGQWFFLGACEPEEILNKGWFTNASSRAMLVHSRWFDVISPKEELIQKTGMATVVNNLSLYAITKEIEVEVVDEQGRLVEGALVDFEVINYSEFCPIASILTDASGKVNFTTGLGTLHIHVSKEGVYTQSRVDIRGNQKVSIVLKAENVVGTWIDQEMIAPVDAPVNTLKPTLEQKEQGKEKFKEAMQKRLRKVEAFFEGKAEGEHEQVELARGNFEEIRRFLDNKETEHLQIWKEKMLNKLSKKDFRDCQCKVLLEHLEKAVKYVDKYDTEVFVEYILNPRIQLEPVTQYRSFIEAYYTLEQKYAMQMNPRLVWEHIQDRVSTRDELDYPSITTSPVGCLKVGIGNEMSKKILFVAICRTLGIAARINMADESMEYMAGGKFVSVIITDEKQVRLRLTSAAPDVTWTYFQNWSIAKLIEGRYTTLNLMSEEWTQEGLDLELGTGQYRITTSNRLPNGNIFAKVYTLVLEVGEAQTVELSLREARLSEMLEEVVLPEFELQAEDKKIITAKELLTEEKMLLLWLEESKEPTEHILNEIVEKQEAFKALEEQIVFIIKDKAALKDPTLSKVLEVLDRVKIYYDDFEENINTLGRRMYVDPDKLPLIMVTQKGLHGIYATSGYNVGTGDMLLRILNSKDK
ncbi:MAG: transglutaminase domain-containing protein [Cellulosilyticaceae bacterium]